MKRILIGFTVLLLLSTAGYTAVTWRARQESAAQLQPMASSPAVNEQLVAEGMVAPVQHSVLSLPTGGIVAAVLITEGDRVTAGQPLIRLDQARAEANVAQAEANLAQAAYEKLRTGATPEEIAIVKAQLRVSEAQLQQTTGSVTSADRTAAQAQAHLAELQAGTKGTDLRASEAQFAAAQANLTAQRNQLSAAKTNAQLQMEQRVNDLIRAQSAFATALQNWQYVEDTGKNPLNETIEPKTASAPT